MLGLAMEEAEGVDRESLPELLETVLAIRRPEI